MRSVVVVHLLEGENRYAMLRSHSNPFIARARRERGWGCHGRALCGRALFYGVDVVESLPPVLKEKETEEKHLDDEMNGAADTDPRIKKQAGAVSGSPAAADPEMRRAALM